MRERGSKMSKKLLFGTCLLLLASCSVGPDYRRPDFYSDARLQKSLNLKPGADKVSLYWYRDFNDPVLNSLIDDGLRQSTDVKIAIEKMRQARQNLRINSVKYLPTVDASGSYYYLKDSRAYTGEPLSTDYFQLGLDAAWEIDIWGGGRRLTEQSKALFAATSANLQNVQLALTAEIASTYVQLRQAQEQLHNARRNEALQSSLYDLVKRKYEAGLTDDISYNQASYLLSSTRETIPQLEASVNTLQNSLATLTSKLPGEINDRLAAGETNLVRQPLRYDTSRLYQLPVGVIRNRPDIRALEYQLMAQNAAVGQAIAELFPNVSLSAFWGYQSKNMSSLIGGGSNTYNYSPAVKLPIFHWGALVNNVELQKSLTRENALQYKQGILNAASEIKNAADNVEKEYRRNRETEKSLASQQEVADLTNAKYQNGLVDFSEVLTAQQNLLNAQNSRIESNADIYNYIISFYKAVGGGYDISSIPDTRKAGRGAAGALCKG